MSIVLCVDADARQRAAASTLLKQIGCSSVAVRDAWEALETFSAHHPDIALILIDAGVEGLPASTLLQRIGRIDARVPIVLLGEPNARDSHGSHDSRESHDVCNSQDAGDLCAPADSSDGEGATETLAAAESVAREEETCDHTAQVVGVLRKPLDAGELIAVLPAALRAIAFAMTRAPQPPEPHQTAAPVAAPVTAPAPIGPAAIPTASPAPNSVTAMSVLAAAAAGTDQSAEIGDRSRDRNSGDRSGGAFPVVAASRGFQWPPSEEDLARISVIDTGAAHGDEGSRGDGNGDVGRFMANRGATGDGRDSAPATRVWSAAIQSPQDAGENSFVVRADSRAPWKAGGARVSPAVDMLAASQTMAPLTAPRAVVQAQAVTTWSPPPIAGAEAAARREPTAWSRSQRIVATAMATLCGVGLTTWLEVRGATPRIDAGRPAALLTSMPLTKAPRSSAPHLPLAIAARPAGVPTRASAEPERSRRRTTPRGGRRIAANPAASRVSRQAVAVTSASTASSSRESSTSSSHASADSKRVNAPVRRRTSRAPVASASAQPPGRFAALVRETPRIVARPFAAVWRSLRGPGAADDRLRAN